MPNDLLTPNKAWSEQRHAEDGRLRDLDCSIGPGHFQTDPATPEAAQ